MALWKFLKIFTCKAALLFLMLLILTSCDGDAEAVNDSKLNFDTADSRNIRFAFAYGSGASLQREVFSDIEMMTSNSLKLNLISNIF